MLSMALSVPPTQDAILRFPFRRNSLGSHNVEERRSTGTRNERCMKNQTTATTWVFSIATGKDCQRIVRQHHVASEPC